MWSDLHEGVLTTGKLKGALGFDCAEAAKVLGVGQVSPGHQPSGIYRAQRAVYMYNSRARSCMGQMMSADSPVLDSHRHGPVPCTGLTDLPSLTAV